MDELEGAWRIGQRQGREEERQRIIKQLELADLVCKGDYNFCKMCHQTGTNPYATGCVMNGVLKIIRGE